MCTSKPSNITVYANGGSGTLTYLANGNISNDYEINGFNGTGLYVVNIVDDNGCTVDSVINIPDPNIVSFNTDTICLGDSLLMDGLANFTDFHTFIWADTDIFSAETSVMYLQTKQLIILFLLGIMDVILFYHF